MLKYLRSELYKLTHRRVYWLWTLAVLLGGEGLLLVLLRVAGFSNAATFSDAVGILPWTLSLGFFLTIVMDDLVFSDQYKLNTLKNEVAAGMDRPRIYLGKLAAAMLSAVGACAVVVGFYVAGSRVLFPVGDPQAAQRVLLALARSLAVAFPLWLGALAYAHMLMFLMKGSAAAIVVFVITLLLGEMLDVTKFILPKLSQVLVAVQCCLITTPMDSVPRGTFDIPYAWTVGMAWLAVSTVLGVVSFQRREIS